MWWECPAKSPVPSRPTVETVGYVVGMPSE